MTEVIENSDTIQCYNKNDKCEECGNKPVEFIHFGILTDGKAKKLCSPCFVEKVKTDETVTVQVNDK